MSEQIKDGTGRGFLAKVTRDNELLIHGSTETHLSEAVGNGRAWNLGTGYLTLTSANASDILYLKNTGIEDLSIDLYVVLTKASTGGAGGEVLVEILRNPTAGTVISDANSLTPVNMDFSAAATIFGDMYYGGEGKTLTGHTQSLNSKTTDNNRLLLGILTKIPQGASVGMRVTPPTGNTSMDVEAIIEVYEDSAN
jgi:hypothetical protein